MGRSLPKARPDLHLDPQTTSRVSKKKSVKRTKTFTGCWTCRSRGVKCDEAKPACQRCTKASWHCEGYGFRLVWLDETKSSTVHDGENCSQQVHPLKESGAQRRLFSRSKIETVALNEEAIDLILTMLDYSGLPLPQYAAPFGVFRAAANAEDQESGHEVLENTEFECMQQSHCDFLFSPARRAILSDSITYDCAAVDELEVHQNGSENDLSQALTPFSAPIDFDLAQYEGMKFTDSGTDLSYQVRSMSPATMAFFDLSGALPAISRIPYSLSTFSLPSRKDERELMHHWVSTMSRTMAPMDDESNPYISIYIPLALEASEQTSPLTGQFALRHTMYALAAFNLAQRGINMEKYEALGIKHHQLGIQHLSTSLLVQGSRQNIFVLATIIVMFTIELAKARPGWRIHFEGGRKWLQEAVGLIRPRGRDAATLYQMFLIGEALGFSHQVHDNASNVALIENTVDYNHDDIFGLTAVIPNEDYYLDSMFGLIRPILEAIVHINRLAASGRPSSAEELECLRFKIALSNPRACEFSNVSSGSEVVTKHHAFMWYYACQIYYRHSLCRTPPSQLQTLVKESLVHLRAVEEHELLSGRYGLLWPRFITACEAEEDDLRFAVSDYFRKGKDLGFSNLTSALTIVHEIWRRRDVAAGAKTHHISWRKVAIDLQDDVLLL